MCCDIFCVSSLCWQSSWLGRSNSVGTRVKWYLSCLGCCVVSDQIGSTLLLFLSLFLSLCCCCAAASWQLFLSNINLRFHPAVIFSSICKKISHWSKTTSRLLVQPKLTSCPGPVQADHWSLCQLFFLNDLWNILILLCLSGVSCSWSEARLLG